MPRELPNLLRDLPWPEILRRCRGAAVTAVATVMLCQGARATAPARPAFDLNEIRVEGTTVLPQEQVEEIIYPFLGPGKTADDVAAARAALEAAYQSAGFPTVSVTVPPQRISEAHGVVVFEVIERRVGRLRVVGSRYFVPSAVREGAPSLQPGQVPDMAQVTRDLAGLNLLPDRTVQPALRPGRLPDTVDVDLTVADKFPLHGTLEMNNRYNADTHALRLNASVSYDNFFQRGDTGTLVYSVAPEAVADAEISSASYLFHIPGSRMSLLLSYLHSNSRVTALGTTNVAGRGTTAGFRLLIPLGTTAGFSHSFSLGWDYKKFYELDSFTTTRQITSAPLTYYPVSATYAADWTGERSSTDLTLGMVLGIPHLGDPTAKFDNKRFGAVPGFASLRAGATREQDLPDDVQLWGSVSGQISNQPLVSSEQFGIGGADTVRGYLESETLGDYGAYLQTEIRSPSLTRWVGGKNGPVKSLRVHLFGDAGAVYLRQALVNQHSSDRLYSVGIGTRVNLWGYLNGSLQDAQTLSRGPDTRPGTNRVLFSVSGSF